MCNKIILNILINISRKYKNAVGNTKAENKKQSGNEEIQQKASSEDMSYSHLYA